MKPTIVEYNPDEYRFREWAREGLGQSCLNEVHQSSKIKMLNRSPTCNQLTESFPQIEEIYSSFVLNILREVVGEIAAYQSPPLRFGFTTVGMEAVCFTVTRISGWKMEE